MPVAHVLLPIYRRELVWVVLVRLPTRGAEAVEVLLDVVPAPHAHLEPKREKAKKAHAKQQTESVVSAPQDGDRNKHHNRVEHTQRSCQVRFPSLPATAKPRDPGQSHTSPRCPNREIN